MEERVKVLEKTAKIQGEVLDALKDLTKEIGELKKQQIKLAEQIDLKVKAGKF